VRHGDGPAGDKDGAALAGTAGAAWAGRGQGGATSAAGAALRGVVGKCGVGQRECPRGEIDGAAQAGAAGAAWAAVEVGLAAGAPRAPRAPHRGVAGESGIVQCETPGGDVDGTAPGSSAVGAGGVRTPVSTGTALSGAVLDGDRVQRQR